MRFLISRMLAVVSLAALTISAATAQTTAAGADTPSVKVGTTIFADYTWSQSPETLDAAGNSVHASSFNVARAYLNVTGNVNHWLAFRFTPDIARETGSGSSLAGSYTFRLKYAFGQFNLDDWTTKGSWIRFGLQQTPLLDFEEGIYRYRFQGPIFVDREGFLTSSDNGLSGHWVFPGGYGDVQGGFYNGEGYSKAETNNEKAFQIRATVRPMPLGGAWKGLRITGFLDEDHPVEGGKRTRDVVALTFEHPRVNAGFDYLTAKDSPLPTSATASARGYSIWATPKITGGWELLLRHDQVTPNKSNAGQKRKRDIEGIAYWFAPNKFAVMLDRDSLKQSNFSPSRPNDTRWGLRLLVNF